MEEEKINDYIFKIMLVGNANVGKSSLVMRFCDNEFPENSKATIGIDFKVKTMIINTYNGLCKHIKLQIWDTAGSERHSYALNPIMFRGAHAVILVFAITDKDSFDKIPEWITKMQSLIEDENCYKILVGNKSDLSFKREVLKKDICTMTENYNMKYIETSALNGENVNTMFIELGTDLTNHFVKNFPHNSKEEVVLDIHKKNKEQERETGNNKCCGGT
jgi:Ras-related protein Rab-11A